MLISASKLQLGGLLGLLPTLLVLTPPTAAESSLTCNTFITANPPTFATSDMQQMADQLAQNIVPGDVFDDLGMKFTPNSAHAVTLGGFQICLRNEFLFAGTHVKQEDIAASLNEMIQTCCNGQDRCEGGNSVVTGDTGITVTWDTAAAGDVCRA